MGHDGQLLAAAFAGISLCVLLIIGARLHPFVALLCAALLVGPCSGLSMPDTLQAIQKGAGDILGGTGIVVSLGLSLGAMLTVSGGASALAGRSLRALPARYAPWGSLIAAMVIGLPLFFETGLVLLLPIMAAASRSAPGDGGRSMRLMLMLPALAGLSVLHALVPPHPGPSLAVAELHADLARTMIYGLLVAVPTAIVAGPLFARFISRHVTVEIRDMLPAVAERSAPAGRALLVVLLPVILIVAGHLAGAGHSLGWLVVAANPVLALLLACLLALPLLFGRDLLARDLQRRIWHDAMTPAGGILLSIAGGGALKQVLVSSGFATLFAKSLVGTTISPIIIGWLIAVAIRLATGSATVATITAAGIMPAIASGTSTPPEWIALGVGAGSVFGSHVNDPGFWLVKSYLGTNMIETFKTWSTLEIIISVVALVAILIGSAIV